MAASVAELCQRQGITLEQLAERSALSADRVAAIVMGRWTPSPEERRKVAAVCDVPVEEIAWGHKTPIQHLYGHGPG
jgi:transcriptional regulator with XRE-family HTH domain